jgi:hypothetical protein
MCDKCKPLDERIAHYRELGRLIADEQTFAGIADLIRDIEEQKKALHPDQ